MKTYRKLKKFGYCETYKEKNKKKKEKKIFVLINIKGFLKNVNKFISQRILKESKLKRRRFNLWWKFYRKLFIAQCKLFNINSHSWSLQMNEKGPESGIKSIILNQMKWSLVEFLSVALNWIKKINSNFIRPLKLNFLLPFHREVNYLHTPLGKLP